MNLKEIFRIQNVLKESGYFDISRIAKEIYEYSTLHNIPLDSILKRISNLEPWEYIRGFTEFRGKNFLVTKDTLIPRIESEQLVDIAMELVEKENVKKVIDVGTGSGCLIISIAEETNKEDVEYIGVDISKETLKVAEKNDRKSTVVFKQQDLIHEDDLEDSTLIVANLPYIPTGMYEKLERSVKDFEPKLALDGGEDGLLYYKKLVQLITNSEKKILLLIEIEPSTLEDLKQYLEDTPIKIFRDYRSKERFVLLHFS